MLSGFGGCRHRVADKTARWILALAVFGCGSAHAAEIPTKTQTASFIPPIVEHSKLSDQGAEWALPAVLSEAEAGRYRRLFALQEAGNWNEADRLIRQVKDPVLLGHLLAQRYVHASYRSKYKELKDWLADYADLPDAAVIYKLALTRKPANTAAPKAPTRVAPSEYDGDDDSGLSKTPTEPTKRLSEADRRKAANLQQRFRSALKKSAAAGKNLLLEDDSKKLLSPVEYDRARAALGQSYFNEGQDESALEWAGGAAKRSGVWLPDAYWTAGLAAWRLQRLGVAAQYFEKVAIAKGVSPWLASAGAFWAARAHLRDRHPDRYNEWLGKAATYQRTFYGLLAVRLLGQEPYFRWTSPILEGAARAELEKPGRGRRSLALLQVGETGRAERELRSLAVGADVTLSRGILAVAAETGMAGLAMKINSALHPNGGGYDGAAYPVMDWEPEDGFRVDRALILAFIRQESAFNPHAKSWAGAHGLMQLMPRTASFVARNMRLSSATQKVLFEPEVNLTLGQRYIEILRDDDKIDGGLFQIVAAWNGGPGNLQKWQRKVDHMDDPLFFIESLPSKETRAFVERVLTNLWIYRNRFGQPAPSLEAIAAGDWPQYEALDLDVQIAETNGPKKR